MQNTKQMSWIIYSIGSSALSHYEYLCQDTCRDSKSRAPCSMVSFFLSIVKQIVSDENWDDIRRIMEEKIVISK